MYEVFSQLARVENELNIFSSVHEREQNSGHILSEEREVNLGHEKKEHAMF